MASYFDEHDCNPLGEGEQPNHTLHFARYRKTGKSMTIAMRDLPSLIQTSH